MFGVLLVTDDASVTRNVRQFVSRLGPVATLLVCRWRDDVAAIAVRAQLQLVLVDVAEASEASLAQLRTIHEAIPRTWLEVIARFDDIETTRAMREAGANEVVPMLHYLARLRVLVPWLMVHAPGNPSSGSS
jgi:DNA-binding NarL/FixJ family response regulator